MPKTLIVQMEKGELRKPDSESTRITEILASSKESERSREPETIQPPTSLEKDLREMNAEEDNEDAEPDARRKVGVKPDALHQEEAGQDAEIENEDAKPDARRKT